MCSRERDAVVTRTLNDQCGGGFRGEAVHRLQFHHAMAECSNDAPAAGRCSNRHGQGTQANDPLGQNEFWRSEKIQPRREMIEAPSLGAREQRERDNAHGFLRIVCSVTMRHPCGAKDLQLAEPRMNAMPPEPMAPTEKQ